jgi:hypothetical protein
MFISTFKNQFFFYKLIYKLTIVYLHILNGLFLSKYLRKNRKYFNIYEKIPNILIFTKKSLKLKKLQNELYLKYQLVSFEM